MDYLRFKTPVRYISGLLSIALAIHIGVSYLYSGGEVVGEVGGSISIGIVGEWPGETISPLDYGQNLYGDMILRFMFRSLAKNLPDGRGYVADLARCDLSRLESVTCVFIDGVKWSDGTAISSQDAVRTIQALKIKGANEKMSKFLQTVDATSSGNTITIESTSGANPMMLELLTYPIVRSDMIELINTARLTPENYITSGHYTFLKSEHDDTYGYDRVDIGRNEENGDSTWIEKYYFKFFKDAKDLEKNKDSLGIIIPHKNQILGSEENPRFTDYIYSTYEYIGLFFQSERLIGDLRRTLSFHISNSLSGTLIGDMQPIKNIFFSEDPMYQSTTDKPIAGILRSQGYIRRDEILAQISESPIVLTGGAVRYGKNAFFQSPTTEKLYFANGDEESIVLGGSVPSSVDSIAVNGYALKEYKSGNDRFVYRVSPEKGNLVPGKNDYTLTFTYTDGRKTTAETLTIYYMKDGEEKSTIKKNIEELYLKELNTPEQVAKRQIEVNRKKMEAEKLDPRFYYNDKYNPFSLKLLVMNEPKENEKISTTIVKSLTDLGIKVDFEITNQKDLSANLEKGEKNYDMILIGFEASLKRSQLGQFFDSTRANTGINFSKIKLKSLDDLFSKYKLVSDATVSDNVEESILTILRKESVFLPIATPKQKLSADRNIKGITLPNVIGDMRNLVDSISGARIKEVFVMNLRGKGVSHFLSWILQPYE